VREDQMIQHDTSVFGDWARVGGSQIGTVEFTNRSGERLTLMNVNRTRVEENLGVDLVYYSHRFRAFVLVQYKRMVNEGRTYGYRPIDPSYTSELTRMKAVNSTVIPTVSTLELDDYRLNEGPFFFKLCSAHIVDPGSTDMIPGM